MQECLTEALKRCCECGTTKPLDRFYKSKKSHDGHGAKCIDCTLEYNRRYYAENTDRLRAYGRQYYADHQEYRKQYSRDYYEDNRDACLEYNKNWHLENPDKAKSRNSRYKRENADRVRVVNSARRARMAMVSIVPFTAEQLAAKWSYWGDKCWICAETATATDHVKPISKGGWHILANLRPICAPCNSSKNDTWPFPLTTASSPSRVPIKNLIKKGM